MNGHLGSFPLTVVAIAVDNSELTLEIYHVGHLEKSYSCVFTDL